MDQASINAYIGNRIRERCEELGMTASELALEVDIPLSTLSLYINGSRSIKAGKLNDIAIAQKVPLSYYQVPELDKYTNVSDKQSKICTMLNALPIEKRKMMEKMFLVQLESLT